MVHGHRIIRLIDFISHYLIELTATEPMDHESLVTSQAMYAYDDDSKNSISNSWKEIAFIVSVKEEDGTYRRISILFL